MKGYKYYTKKALLKSAKNRGVWGEMIKPP